MSLPIDIPWKRMAVAEDMIDQEGGNLQFPQQWNSSIAVFYHEPTELPPEYCDRKITYLKIVCTLSNYQPEEYELDEISGLLDALSSSYYMEYGYVQKVIEELLLRQLSLPCYGALLQIGVYPNPKVGVARHDYPYIAAFEPQKREMYEAVTESGEILSQSSNRVNVGKQITDTLSNEKYDLDTGSSSSWGSSSSHGESWGAAFGAGQGSWENASSNQGSRSQTGQWGTVARNNQEDQQVTSIDSSREKRESVSHSTSLNHIYSLLQGFHLGTNRVLFTLQPRPHIQDTKFSFVQGRRLLEGIQEFFLIVNRPASVPGLCVEATLETGHHLGFKDYKPRLIPLSELYSPENLAKTAEALGIDPNSSIANYTFYAKLMEKWNESALLVRMLVQQYIKDPNSVHFANYGISNDTLFYLLRVPTKLPEIGIEDIAIIFEEYENTEGGHIFLVGRYVKGCMVPETHEEGTAVDKEKSTADNISTQKTGASIVYTAPYFGMANALSGSSASALNGKKYNTMVQGLNQAFLKSMGSPDRVPLGKLGFFETEFVMERMALLLSQLAEDGMEGKPLQDIASIRPLVEKGLGKRSGIKQALDLHRLSTSDIAQDLQVSRIEAMKIRSRLLRETIKALDFKSFKPKKPLKNPIQAMFDRKYPQEKLSRLVKSAHLVSEKAAKPLGPRKPTAKKKNRAKKK